LGELKRLRGRKIRRTWEKRNPRESLSPRIYISLI
jgi:hypothetical protein